MMPLRLAAINSVAPYRVLQAIEDDTYFFFETEHGVLYKVGFMDDYSILREGAYQIIINNENHKSSPNDVKLKQTLFAIFEEFFAMNQEVLLYLCETGDGKQAFRNRLFLRWFNQYENKNAYILISATGIVEGQENFAAMIIRRDNPDADIVISEFNETVELLLDNKPESSI